MPTRSGHILKQKKDRRKRENEGEDEETQQKLYKQTKNQKRLMVRSMDNLAVAVNRSNVHFQTFSKLC